MRTATVHIPDNCPLCGHKSVTPAADGSGYRCGQPPCGWGIFTAPPEQAKAFTGKKEDKLGREQCYQQGTHIPCKVLAHVAGPSGSGKTTLVDNVKKKYGDKIEARDLDEFDEAAVDSLGWSKIKKNDYTDDMLKKLTVKRQQLMNEWLSQQKKPVVLAGHHWEGEHVLDIPTKNRFMLDVDAETAAQRAYERSQKEPEQSRRKIEELPDDIKEAQSDIDKLESMGYERRSRDDIEKWIGENVSKKQEKTMSAYQGGLGAELVAPPKFMGSTPTKPKKVKALKSKYKRLSEYKVGDRVTLQSSPIVYVLREQLGGGAWRAITYDKLESGLTYLVHERYMKPYYEQKSSHSNPEDQNQVDQLAVETKSWWGSSIPKNIAIKGGFSGRKKDKLGRQRCYSAGKPVPCVPAPQAPGVGRRIGGAIGGTIGALTGTGLGSAVGMAVASSGRGKKEGEGAIIDKLKTPRSPREQAIWQAGGAIAGGIGGAVSGGLEGHKIGGYVGEKLEQGVRGVGHVLSAPFRKKSLGLSLRDHHKSIGGKIGAAVGGVVGAGVGLTGAAAAAHGVTSRPRSYGILKSPAWTAGAVGVGAAGAAAGAHVGGKVGEAVEHGVRKVASHFTGKPAAPKSLDMESKGGFTGRRKDKLKRERCYNQGKLVPCGQGESGKQKPTGKKGEEKKGGVRNKLIGAGVTAATIAGIIAYIYIDDVMRKRRARDLQSTIHEADPQVAQDAEEDMAAREQQAKENRKQRVEEFKNNPSDPIRAGLERMRFHSEERLALREAEVTDAKLLMAGGSDETYMVELSEGGKGIWKPAIGEAIRCREGVKPGDCFRRNVATSAVADLLGFDDLVPTTEFKELNGEPGSIQHFVKNASMAFEFPESQVYDGDEDAARAAVFDYIAGHMDRHQANWLLDGGKIFLIDNNWTFPDKKQTGYGPRCFEGYASDKDLPMPDISRIQGKWPQMEKLLKESGLKPTAIAYTKARYDTVASGNYQKVKDLPKMWKLDWEGADNESDEEEEPLIQEVDARSTGAE